MEWLARNSRASGDAGLCGTPMGKVRHAGEAGGTRVQATPQELTKWLGHEVSEPIEIATQRTDLNAELKRDLSFIRARRNRKKKIA